MTDEGDGRLMTTVILIWWLMAITLTIQYSALILQGLITVQSSPLVLLDSMLCETPPPHHPAHITLTLTSQYCLDLAGSDCCANKTRLVCTLSWSCMVWSLCKQNQTSQYSVLILQGLMLCKQDQTSQYSVLILQGLITVQTRPNYPVLYLDLAGSDCFTKKTKLFSTLSWSCRVWSLCKQDQTSQYSVLILQGLITVQTRPN